MILRFGNLRKMMSQMMLNGIVLGAKAGQAGIWSVV